jgi:hypothetical protein
LNLTDTLYRDLLIQDVIVQHRKPNGNGLSLKLECPHHITRHYETCQDAGNMTLRECPERYMTFSLHDK